MDYFSEANKLYNLKEYNKAIDLYKKSIETKENTACAYYNAGVWFIDMIKNALSIQKESKYFFNLAYCYAMKEDTNKALIYFNRAWSLDSTDKDCEKAINLIMANKKAL